MNQNSSSANAKIQNNGKESRYDSFRNVQVEDSDFLVCPSCGRAYPKMDWLNILLSITFALALVCLAALYRTGEIILKRRYIVKHPLRAAKVGNRDESITFKPGASVWCEADQFSDPIIFEVDAVEFESERIHFAKSVEL